jgi:hypothetical protein
LPDETVAAEAGIGIETKPVATIRVAEINATLRRRFLNGDFTFWGPLILGNHPPVSVKKRTKTRQSAVPVEAK